MKLAYIVPTKDRPDDMRTLLRSIAGQTLAAHQIIVVDGSNPTIEHVIAEFPNLSITYVRVFPPSLAAQRNAGVDALSPDADLVGFLDDDLVLEPNASEAMLDFWATATADTGGAGFAILNQPIATAARISRFFLIDHPAPGRLLASGFQSQIPPLTRLTETQWLYGGATVWRRQVIEQYRYDDWYLGHGYLEDVDFSHRVNRTHRLFVVGTASVNHYSRPVRSSAQFMIGRQQVVNRVYFVSKFPHFSRLAFAWALFGQIIFNLSSSLYRGNLDGLRRAAGNAAGLFDQIGNRGRRLGGYYK